MQSSLRDLLKHALGGYFLEARSLFAATNARTGDARHFVFFGRGRSGSTMLVEMLNAHPNVTCLGEILRYRTVAPATYIRNRMATCPQAARGFKLLSYQVRSLSKASQSAVRDWIKSEEATIFHLRRDNLLQHAVSNIYAARRRTYHSRDKGAERHRSIRIAPEELIQWMEGSRALLDFELSYLEGVDRFEITYERHLADLGLQQETYAAILEKLGLPYHPSATSLKKVTPPDLGTLIENFAEIEAVLGRTSYKQYLPC